MLSSASCSDTSRPICESAGMSRSVWSRSRKPKRMAVRKYGAPFVDRGLGDLTALHRGRRFCGFINFPDGISRSSPLLAASTAL